MLFPRAIQYYEGWNSMRRGYVYVISKQILKIIKAQEDILFSEDAQTKYGPFDVGKILTATSPREIDDLYCRYVSACIFSETMRSDDHCFQLCISFK